MAFNGTSTAPTLPVSIVELRRYTLHPGRRDTLIALFESELVDPQEAVGMSVIGQFRDLDAPDSFVWLRGFPDMRARRRSLEAFYGGPVWRRHRDAANATIIDSDDVLLLRPAAPLPSPSGEGAPAPAVASAVDARGWGFFLLTTYHLRSGASDEFAGVFSARIEPALAAAGATVVARLQTEHAPNDFPTLPVRHDAEVFVTLARLADADAYARYAAESKGHRSDPEVQRLLAGQPETARLTPTERSKLRL
jgi:NIPSNAP